MDPSLSSPAPWQSGLQGARSNLGPGLVLQLAALALVLGYYYDPQVHRVLAQLAEFRRSTGFAFGIVSTALSAGVLPFLYLHFGPRAPDGQPHYGWIQGLGLTAFWAYKGFEVDLFYRIQAHLFGTGHGAATIALKAMVDQFGYSPFFAVPCTVAFYQAVDANFDWSRLIADLRKPGWCRRRLLPVIISNEAVWLPAVAIIYALPTPLQLPLQNIVLGFFTLIVAHQTRTEAAPAAPDGAKSEEPCLGRA